MFMPTYAQANVLVVCAMMLLTSYYLVLNVVSKHLLTVYFWIHLATYIGINIIFLAQGYQASSDADPLTVIALDFTYTNFPLYLLSSACLIGSYIVLNYMSKRYAIAKIVALSQLSIIVSTIGYHFLGDRMTAVSVTSLCIIICGSFISGLTFFSFKHVGRIVKEYDRHLLGWSILVAFLIAIPELVTYLCTAHHSPTTRLILKMLTKHARGIPFTTVIPLYMNIGVQFFNMVLLLLWIVKTMTGKHELRDTLHIYARTIGGLVLIHVGYIYCYYTAFSAIENKNIISAIIQMYLPLTMVISVFFLRQKWNTYEMVGMSLIAMGSLLSIATELS